MTLGLSPKDLLVHEARALLSRLSRVPPLALTETMVPAAALSSAAQLAIDRFLANGRRELRGDVHRFVAAIEGDAEALGPPEWQRRFMILRLRFNACLAQLDTFSQAVSQRSEHQTGTWLGGLDQVATEALERPGVYESPPVVCYLDRGMGAAIRRARTRLPGGGLNPVAIIRVPRERMVGTGIGSSLIHEVGHQGAALLDSVPSLRADLAANAHTAPDVRVARSWDRWISEIVADFWSVATLGIASTLGLMAVVSLPTPFVFRENQDDPHPTPWLRVKLSCGIGRELYPDPQWEALARTWERLYPIATQPEHVRRTIRSIESDIPRFARLLAAHRPKALRGAPLAALFPTSARRPALLRALFRRPRGVVEELRRRPPTLAFAVLGQARADGALDGSAESQIIGSLLTHWALQGTFDASERCGVALKRQKAAA